MDSKTVNLNFLTLGDLENEPFSKKKWSVPLSVQSVHFAGPLYIYNIYRKPVRGTTERMF